MLNIAEAAEWAERSRKLRSNLLSSEALRLLHKRMFDKTWRWAGSYRITQKSIGVEAFRIATELHNLNEDARVWLATRAYAPIELLARFHHRLVLIHPFPNGNGRHARLATDRLAVNQGWFLPTWGAAYDSNPTELRSQYIAALRQADENDIQPLINFMNEERESLESPRSLKSP